MRFKAATLVTAGVLLVSPIAAAGTAHAAAPAAQATNGTDDADYTGLWGLLGLLGLAGLIRRREDATHTTAMRDDVRR